MILETKKNYVFIVLLAFYWGVGIYYTHIPLYNPW